MKKICKQPEPTWFSEWKENFLKVNGRNADYKNDFPQNEKRKLRQCLLEEQGYICCYCMKRIDLDSSHIEHFWPKGVPQFHNLDMEYGNMFASCQGNPEAEDHCGHKKNEWYDMDMIIPTDERIESAFKFTIDGKIHSTGTYKTKKVKDDMSYYLGLESFYMVRNRKKAIEASEYFDECDYSQDEINYFIHVYESMDSGKYQEYCKAITDVLKTY